MSLFKRNEPTLPSMASNAREKQKTIEIPKKETKFTDFLFDPNKVDLAYIDKDGGIRIVYNNQDLSLQYDKDLFKELKENFNNRQLN